MFLAGLSLSGGGNGRGHSTIYSIRNGTAHLGRLVTYARAYRPGEPLDGAFDFTNATLRCYQVRWALM
jgi:hypothetical protein